MKPASPSNRRQCVTCGKSLPERYSKAERCRSCHQQQVTRPAVLTGSCLDCGKALRNPASARCRTCFLKHTRKSDWQPRAADWTPRDALVVPPSATTEAERAYAAGMIDGDGWVGSLVWKGNALPVVVVTNTDQRLIDWFAARWDGGNQAVFTRNGDRHKPRINWRLSGRRAYAFLKETAPYLVAKQEQAQLVFAYYDQGGYFQSGSRRLPDEEILRRLQLHLRLKALNARGPRE
jgi:hypothetical protein